MRAATLCFRAFRLLVAFPDLLFDFLCDPVNRRIQIAFAILGKQIGAAHAQAHGTTELFLRRARVVVLQGDPGVHGALVKMVEFLQPAEHMIFDGFGQGDIMRRKNQFHKGKMDLNGDKIQFFSKFRRCSECRAIFACALRELS